MNIKKLTKRKIPVNGRNVYILSIIIVLVLLDLSSPPKDQLSARFLLFSIRKYQEYISPNLSGFVKCKFQPTCSHYAYTSIKWYGAFWGSLKAIERLSRCTPWSDDSGWDPP